MACADAGCDIAEPMIDTEATDENLRPNPAMVTQRRRMGMSGHYTLRLVVTVIMLD